MSTGGWFMAIGAMLEGQGYARAGFAQAASHREAARLARMEGREALAQTDYRVRLISEEAVQVLGGIEAETGKSGLAMTGTALESLVQTARQAELAAAVTRRAGRVEQARWEQKARAEEKAAAEARQAGQWKAISAWVGGFGGLIGS